MNARDKELAIQAGCHSALLLDMYGGEEALCDSEIHELNHLQQFADLIRADEREACAKVCDELHWPWNMGDNSGPKECAEAIRARRRTHDRLPSRGR